ncbi:hypothetical protein [Roseovarius autotrophicus]|uniref:hypothetical protein n=1 Tax=Roseovarius autotrophicus TaxID=2824121 RepID=UPI001B370C16|nr:hypothetical protein [Roseovarius autotrophicus]
MKHAVIIWLASAGGAFAHEGHDMTLPQEGAVHWLMAPVHAPGLVLLAVVLAGLALLRARRR